MRTTMILPIWHHQGIMTPGEIRTPRKCLPYRLGSLAPGRFTPLMYKEAQQSGRINNVVVIVVLPYVTTSTPIFFFRD